MATDKLDLPALFGEDFEWAVWHAADMLNLCSSSDEKASAEAMFEDLCQKYSIELTSELVEGLAELNCINTERN